MTRLDFLCLVFLITNQNLLSNAAPKKQINSKTDLGQTQQQFEPPYYGSHDGPHNAPHIPPEPEQENQDNPSVKRVFESIGTARQFAILGLILALVAIICSVIVACCLLCVCIWLCMPYQPRQISSSGSAEKRKSGGKSDKSDKSDKTDSRPNSPARNTDSETEPQPIIRLTSPPPSNTRLLSPPPSIIVQHPDRDCQCRIVYPDRSDGENTPQSPPPPSLPTFQTQTLASDRDCQCKIYERSDVEYSKRYPEPIFGHFFSMNAKVSDPETGSKRRSRTSTPIGDEPPVEKLRWIDDDVHPGDGMSDHVMDTFQMEPVHHSENTMTFSDCCVSRNPASLRLRRSGSHTVSSHERKSVIIVGDSNKPIVKSSDDKTNDKSSDDEEFVNAEKNPEVHTIRLRSLHENPQQRSQDNRSAFHESTAPSRIRDEMPHLNVEAVCLSPTFATVMSCLLLLVAICGLFFLLVGIVIFAPINLIRRRLSGQRMDATESTFRSHAETLRSAIYRTSTPLIREMTAGDDSIEECISQPTIQEVEDDDDFLMNVDQQEQMQTPSGSAITIPNPIPQITEIEFFWM
uniref:Uncharacterized protein n=1 Tax=Strigamia maritima TaxID=126957 RepID=T1IKY3_STRMM